MNISKKSIQSAAVKTVKAVMCVPHLVLQTATDLTNATEATAINLIDGTPVDQSMMDRALYTNAKQQAALNKIEELKSKINEQKERIRVKKIELLRAQLNKAEGVEQVSEPTTEIVQTVTVPAPPVAPAPLVMTAPDVPAQPKQRATRAKKIELLKAQLNKAEGVEQISEHAKEEVIVPAPPVMTAPPVVTAPMVTPTTVPSPPKTRATRAKKETAVA